MIRKKRFIFRYMLIIGGIVLFSGCTTISPKRPKIEIPVPTKRPRKKQKTHEPSPSVSLSAQQLYIRGQRAYYRGEYEEALKNFHSAAESDSSFLEPRVALGKIFLDIGQYEKATQTFAAVIKKDNSYFDAYVGLGEALLNERDYDQSIEALSGALTLIPHHPKAEEVLDVAREKSIEKHLKLGKKKYSLGNLAGGKVEFKKVLKLHPQNIVAHLQMAYILEKEKKYQAAEKHLNKLLAEDTANADALRLLGKILSRTKRLEEAQSAFQRLLEINPLDQDGRIRLQAVQKALFSDPNIQRS
jgi:tetratricopeptide (TPR) repeat protein